MDNANYEFSIDFLGYALPIWENLFKHVGWYGANIRLRGLEIGCFEGRSTTWFLDHVLTSKESELFCCDSFEGGVEHQEFEMEEIERRFHKNVAASESFASVSVLKGNSVDVLPKLLAEGCKETFDFVYVDGSHQAADVLFDLTLSIELARVGGLIICDDYLWEMKTAGVADILMSPKLAIDSFVNINRRRLEILGFPAVQVYMRKTGGVSKVS